MTGSRSPTFGLLKGSTVFFLVDALARSDRFRPAIHPQRCLRRRPRGTATTANARVRILRHARVRPYTVHVDANQPKEHHRVHRAPHRAARRGGSSRRAAAASRAASGAGLRRLYTESTMRSSACRCGRGRSPPLTLPALRTCAAEDEQTDASLRVRHRRTRRNRAQSEHCRRARGRIEDLTKCGCCFARDCSRKLSRAP